MPSPAPDWTNQFRCNACGRYFNTEEQLRTHEPECRLAKQATPAGAESLEEEDARSHARNDSDKRLDQEPD
jgi:hypothetical protein